MKREQPSMHSFVTTQETEARNHHYLWPRVASQLTGQQSQQTQRWQPGMEAVLAGVLGVLHAVPQPVHGGVELLILLALGCQSPACLVSLQQGPNQNLRPAPIHSCPAVLKQGIGVCLI